MSTAAQFLQISRSQTKISLFVAAAIMFLAIGSLCAPAPLDGAHWLRLLLTFVVWGGAAAIALTESPDALPMNSAVVIGATSYPSSAAGHSVRARTDCHDLHAERPRSDGNRGIALAI